MNKKETEPHFASFISTILAICNNRDFKPTSLETLVSSLQFDETKRILHEPHLNYKPKSSKPANKASQTKTIIPPKNHWKAEYDDLVFEITKKYRFDWKRIEIRVKNLTGQKKTISFLKGRYLIASGKTTEKPVKDFSPEEDSIIQQGIVNFGLDWAKIVQDLPERSVTSVKNRYYYLKGKNKVI